MEKLIKKVEKIFVKESGINKAKEIKLFCEKTTARTLYKDLNSLFDNLKFSLDSFWLYATKEDGWGCKACLGSIEDFGFDIFGKLINLYKHLFPITNNTSGELKSSDSKKDFNEIVHFELKRAQKIHGDSFISTHEAFSVMCWVFEKAQEEKDFISPALYLDEVLYKQIAQAENSLILLACKIVQVVAMARKAQSVIEVEDD